MVTLWLLGDILKLLFMLFEKQPINFVIGAATQIIFEVVIMYQFVLYTKRKYPIFEEEDQEEKTKLINS